MSDTPQYPHLVAALADTAGITPQRMFAALRAERALIDSGADVGPRPMLVLGLYSDPLHGPREDRNPHLSGRDCGCGWGDLCDASPHGICDATPYRNVS